MGGDMVVRSSIYPLEEHHIASAAVTTIIPVHFPYQAIKSTSFCFVYVKNLVLTWFVETSFLEK